MTAILDRLGEWVWQWRTPRPTGLSPSAVSLSDQELAWEAFEAACQALKESRGAYSRKVRLLPPHWRFVYVMLKLDLEVKNGGFHQFFTNASGNYDSHLERDLALLQNPAFKELIARAIGLYRGIDYTDQWKNLGKSWDYFASAYKEGRFEQEDSEYYSLKPELDELIGKHIRDRFREYRSAEPGASPNGGPTTSSGNSEVTEGPPSVS